MTTQTKHTPLPWGLEVLGGGLRIVDAPNKEGFTNDIFILGDCRNKKITANATFIVTACNSHYDLLEACKVALEALRSMRESGDCGNYPKQPEEHKLEQAIAKAEGEINGNVYKRINSRPRCS